MVALASVIAETFRTDVGRYCSEIVAEASIELDAALAESGNARSTLEDAEVMSSISTEEMLSEFESIFSRREALVRQRAWSIEGVFSELTLRAGKPVETLWMNEEAPLRAPVAPDPNLLQADQDQRGIIGTSVEDRPIMVRPDDPATSEMAVGPRPDPHFSDEGPRPLRPEWLINAAVIALTLAVVAMVLAVMGAF